MCILKTKIRAKMLLGKLGHVTGAVWCTIESTEEGALCERCQH